MVKRFLLALALLIPLAAAADWPDLTTEAGTWPESEGGGAAPIGPPANIIFGPEDFEASNAACGNIGTTQTRGDFNCACATGTGDCPLEGDFSFRGNADDNGTGAIEWRSQIPVQGGTGLMLIDLLVDQEAPYTFTTATPLIRFRFGSSARIQINGDGDAGTGGILAFSCRTLAGVTGDFFDANVPPTTSKLRLAVGFDGPGCDALGLGAIDVGNDGNCCGVWADPTTGDFGGTLGAFADDVFSANTINGLVLGPDVVSTVGLGTWIWDDFAICDEVPPVGGKCGDLP